MLFRATSLSLRSGIRSRSRVKAQDSTIIDGGQLDRVFQVAKGVNVVLERADDSKWHRARRRSCGRLPDTGFSAGGGIFNAGTLELDGVIVQSCVAQAGPAARMALGGTRVRRLWRRCLQRRDADDQPMHHP